MSQAQPMKWCLFLSLVVLMLIGCMGQARKPGSNATATLKTMILLTPTYIDADLNGTTPTSIIGNLNISKSPMPVSPTYSIPIYTPTQIDKSALNTMSPTQLTITPITTRKPPKTTTPGLPSGLSPLGWIAVAFTGNSGNGIGLARPDGSEWKRITKEEGFKYNYASPTWSPDGHWLIFTRTDSSGVYQLFTMDISNDRIRQLTSGHIHKLNPSWAPDGQWIVYEERNEIIRKLLFKLYILL